MDIYQFWHPHNNDRTAKIIASWLYIIFLSRVSRERVQYYQRKAFIIKIIKIIIESTTTQKQQQHLNCQKNPSQRDNFLLKNKNYSKSKLVDVQNSLKMDERQNECEPTCSSDKVVGKSDKKHNVQASNDDDDEDQEIPQAKLVETYYEYLVLISIILIIFAAFRNSVTWWVHQFIYFHSLAIDAIVSR